MKLGHGLGTRAVAKGIKAAGQFRELRRLGCHLGQGLYLAGPLEAQSGEALLWLGVTDILDPDGSLADFSIGAAG